jgi:hypothetical protein
MGLIKEKYGYRLRRVSCLRELFEELGDQPEKQGCIGLGGLRQPVGSEDIDHAMTIRINPGKVGHLQGWFTEETFCTLLLQGKQAALDRADACGRDIPITRPEFLCMITDIHGHGTQIFQVQLENLLVIGDLEEGAEYISLDIIQVQYPGEEERAHLGDGGPDGMSLFPIDIPECYRISFKRKLVQS